MRHRVGRGVGLRSWRGVGPGRPPPRPAGGRGPGGCPVGEPLTRAPLFGVRGSLSRDNEVCVTGGVRRRWEGARVHGNAGGGRGLHRSHLAAFGEAAFSSGTRDHLEEEAGPRSIASPSPLPLGVGRLRGPLAFLTAGLYQSPRGAATPRKKKPMKSWMCRAARRRQARGARPALGEEGRSLSGRL